MAKRLGGGGGRIGRRGGDDDATIARKSRAVKLGSIFETRSGTLTQLICIPQRNKAFEAESAGRGTHSNRSGGDCDGVRVHMRLLSGLLLLLLQPHNLQASECKQCA